jgi:hypothetical protein
MKKIYLNVLLALFATGAFAQTAVPTPDLQIKSALLAAPADKRAEATVYGFAGKEELVVLRQGKNEMVCLADNPFVTGFSASCYHRDLQPFMARGQELRKQGKTGQQIFDLREAEVKAGKLTMPKQPTTLFVLSAPEENYNRTTGEVKNGYLRYVVYIPYATPESTGLPLKPEGPAMPWIMHPGTHGAHIMINPPKN